VASKPTYQENPGAGAVARSRQDFNIGNCRANVDSTSQLA
jgi:hypothetical protein